MSLPVQSYLSTGDMDGEISVTFLRSDLQETCKNVITGEKQINKLNKHKNPNRKKEKKPQTKKPPTVGSLC